MSGLQLAGAATTGRISEGRAAEIQIGRGRTAGSYFPLIEKLPSPVSALAGPKTPNGETLLVVEDEADLRHLAVAVLEGDGYTVLRAPNGQDALRVVREHTGERIELVVSDVIMPQMNGKVMAEWLQTLDPDLKVLFTSGYSDDLIADSGVLHAGVAYLPKPFTSSELSRKVREVLNEGKGNDIVTVP